MIVRWQIEVYTSKLLFNSQFNYRNEHAKKVEKLEETLREKTDLLKQKDTELIESNKKIDKVEETNRAYEVLMKNKDNEMERLKVAFKTSTEKTEVLESLIEEQK